MGGCNGGGGGGGGGATGHGGGGAYGHVGRGGTRGADVPEEHLKGEEAVLKTARDIFVLSYCYAIWTGIILASW